ncbi:MAG: DUF4079 domain-containing protein [Kastovskya adunca ATA6-11-RM4]|nr:DUF4079 domain-containing protein [Kastovskya adunca ATA6-11-RM4]
MNLPSFLWLWKAAAWSMGLSLFAYLLLAMTGIWMFSKRQAGRPRPRWLRPFHYITGGIMVSLVLLLLGIGIVGTLGHFGSLGHSSHLLYGFIVVALTLISFASATQIGSRHSWARPVHISTNIALFVGFALVSLTGWDVVQKYLP